MEFYIDSADLNIIKEYSALSLFTGVTTTPTFFWRQKITDNELHIRSIIEVIDGSVHIEAMGSNCDEIVDHARRNFQISNRIVSKIPFSKEGLKAVRKLKYEGIRSNVHLVFSVSQAALAAESGADFICPLIGRLNDIDGNGLKMIKNIVSVIKGCGYPTKIVAASIRSHEEVTQCLLCGVDAITLPPKIIELMLSHPLTDIGTERFYRDMVINGCVEEVMKHGSDMPILNIQSTLLHALTVMTEKKIGLGIIVDSDNVLAGIITDGDIRRHLKDTGHNINKPIGEIMNKSPETANAAAPLCHVLEQMEQKRITAIVITNGNTEPIGYLNLHDLLQLKMPTGAIKSVL
ncbi:MAG: transaldolase family protein [Planctomycetota bacterium]|jgi:TalC/MipB family fructose-6-phosphate aldolase